MLTPSAFAVDTIILHLGRISGSGWSAESLDLELDWLQGSAASYRIRAKEIIHPALSSPLKDLMITCQQGAVSDHKIACQKGMLHLQHPILDDPQIAVSFEWNRLQQKLDAQLNELHFASGLLKITLQSGSKEWKLDIDANAVDMAVVRQQLEAYLATALDVELAGKIDLVASVTGVAELPSKLQWRAEFNETAFSDASGEYLGEALSGNWQGSFALEKEEWRGETALILQQGELLTPYAYIGVETQPLSINAELKFNQQQLQLDALRYDHPNVLAFTSSAMVLRQQPLVIEAFQLQTKPFAIKKVYQQYLLPTLAESTFANLELAGEAQLDLSYKIDAEQRLTLKLDDVHVEEAQAALTDEIEEEESVQQRRRFGLYGVNGALNWISGQEPVASTLSWDGGHLMEDVTLGGAHLDLALHEKNVSLLKHSSIPVLDGSLAISTFDLTLDDEPRFMFGGALTPISMEAFSQAMGWVPLSGKISGGIPKATYQNGVLTLGGAMMANVFEGQAIIRDLRVEDMFGVWPILNANFELKDLDLEALTSTFSFGKITGKLEGRIDDLYLENWKPVSFNARFATPEQDASRHRISQRAIDNISNLGGSGMSGALSRSFLSFFEEFGYARLGVSCHLENGVCEMDGVEAAAQGSYLVKGSGLPRIDIVGYNHQVDWALLIGKLTEIAATGVGNAEFE